MMDGRLARMAAILAGLAACGSPSRLDDEAMRAEVRLLLDEWAHALSEGRVEDFKALFAERAGFTWVERGEVVYRSADEIAAGIDGILETDASFVTTIENVAVERLAGDAATFAADIESRVETGDVVFSFDGVVTGVAIREDGAWKLYQGHVSEPPGKGAEGP